MSSTSLSDNNTLVYPKSWKEPFSLALFRSPTSEYRGAPLWSWNNKLRSSQLIRQIDQLAEMGFGGFHMHSRVGLDTPYMGEEFMQCVKDSVEHAKAKGMLAYLYDEDRWPSGAAGGLVTKGHPEYGTKHLLLTTVPYGQMENPHLSKGVLGSAVRSENGELIAKYEVAINSDHKATYRRMSLDEVSPTLPTSAIWYAYLEGNPPSPWFNDQTYVDTLSKDALKRFIELTHQRYYEAVGHEFGKTIPSIFCDEPQFPVKAQLIESGRLGDMFMPWTGDLPRTFRAACEFDILDRLPEILWDTVDATPDNPSLCRYYFHEHVCERFVSAFMDQIAAWCRERHIGLMGHMMQEPTLRSQTETLGEAMRCYRNLDMPGIDILHDAIEFNTAKQASSVSRQRNGSKGGAMSELYGVTNWTFDFTGHKGAGDWQAALGITLRVPHLSPVTLAGEGKRDYPAALSYQSPWYREYRYIENHFARVAVALTRGLAVTRVAVIHPIESFWLCYGPLDRNADEQIHRIEAFEYLSAWLLHGLVDFDFISESLFPEQTELDGIQPGQSLCVGHCKYDMVILPNMRTIRSTTLQRLQRFATGGGKVIIAGSAPNLVNARPSKAASLIQGGQHIAFTKFDVLQAIEPHRDISITEHWGTKAEKLLYQMRQDGDDRYLFICNIDRKKELTTVVKVKGSYTVTVLETFSGSSWLLETSVVDGWTRWNWVFEGAGSLLVTLKPHHAGANGIEHARPQVSYRKNFGTINYVQLEKVTLSEPNVLLLDRAAWRLDGDTEWKPSLEVLRIDNEVRKHFRIPLKGEAYRQPWSIDTESRKQLGTLQLRFEFKCSTVIEGPLDLALENPQSAGIKLDGNDVAPISTGWWVDEEILRVPLLHAGQRLETGLHVLDLDLSFGLLTNVERVYILGDFAVDTRGTEVSISSSDLGAMRFGDWTRQGLPFYAGNVIYHCSFDVPAQAGDQPLAIELPHYEGPVVTAVVDDVEFSKKVITLHPSYAMIGPLSAGRHTLRLTCFGNRENSFGTIHLPSGKTKWHEPNTFRYEYDWYMEEYNIKPMGIIQAPVLKGPGEDVITVRRSKVQKWYN